MDTQLKFIINFWNQYLATEQTVDSLYKSLQKKQLENTMNVGLLWNDLHSRQWLRKGTSGQYGLASQAIHFAEQPEQRISRSEALEIVQQMCSRIQMWNQYAQLKVLPTVAACAVWGSVARPEAVDHGDVDVCLVWRRARANASSVPAPDVSAIPPVECNENCVWDIEDKVEQWLAHHPTVNISGVDQWEEFGLQKDFAAALVFADECWEEDNTGISEIQAQTMRTFANRQLEMGPKCAKIYKR